MVALSLVALFVFIFGAYAYGATTVLAFRRLPVWGSAADEGRKPVLDRVVTILCAVCTLWFALHAFSELRMLTSGMGERGMADLVAVLLSYAFPPLIMHNVLRETLPTQRTARLLRTWPVWTMYAICAATGGYVVAAILDWLPRPPAFSAWIGISIGALFTLCSIYCIAVMTGRTSPARDEPGEPPAVAQQRRVMVGLFVAMIPLFVALVFLHDVRFVSEALDRLSRSIPLFFLVTSIYFENRFEFYDLIVKRAVTLVAMLLTVGAFLALTLGMLDRLPVGPARPWLFAVALLPVTLLLPRLQRTVSHWLDRWWLGRHYSPVEAVQQVLAAMHPATDERALAVATETRLSEMFNTPVRIMLDDAAPPADAVVETISSPPHHGDAGAPLRVAVARLPGSRPLLSEDVALLRSLLNVFGFMLENVRLQRRRQEQDLIAQDLRLQSSRSELKALRAQINPHFLFNALNAIASLIHTDPSRADAAVEQLAEVFRYTLRRSEHDWAPLDQELAFARAYLDVEQARFGRRLTYAIEADAATSGLTVPSMLLHTLVENAVKHGIAQSRAPGSIEIHARAGAGALTLEVTDTGPGLEPRHGTARPGGESFGLRSVRDRLKGHFGDRASLTLTRDPDRKVTHARIEMPIVREHAAAAR